MSHRCWRCGAECDCGYRLVDDCDGCSDCTDIEDDDEPEPAA